MPAYPIPAVHRDTRSRRRRALLAAALCATALITTPAARADTPRGPVAYVASDGGMAGGAVSVIDTDTGTVTDTLLDGLGVNDIALNPTQPTLYATARGITVIDTTTDTVTDTISVAAVDIAVNPAGTRVYASTGTGALSVIDTASDTVLSSVPAIADAAIAISPDGAHLYALDNDVLNILDTATNTVTASIAIPRSAAIAVTRSGAAVYLTGESLDENGNPHGIVTVIDTTTDAITATIPIGQTPQGIAISPTGSLAYAANFDDNDVSVIDTATNTVTGTIHTGMSPSNIAFNAAGTVAWVANLNDSDVVAIDTGTGIITTSTSVPFYVEDVALSQVPQPTTTNLSFSPASPVPAGSPITLTASIAPTATAGSVQFYDDASPLGSPVVVDVGSATLRTVLSTGSHALTAAFTPAASTSLPSTSSPATLQVTAPPGIAIDQTITKTGNGTITTTPITTTGPRLLVAYTASDGPAAKQTTTVTGAGLTWTLAARANKSGTGTAEIWTATAPSALTGATITSTPKTSGYDQSLTVIAYTGASGTGATATADKTGKAPSIMLTTTQANGWVFAVGEDYSAAISRTLGPSQNLISQWVDTTPGETFWTQDLTAPDLELRLA
jgi:YVTN family beta-propeller protein